MVAVDQYGSVVFLRGKAPRKELLEATGSRSCAKMYADRATGETKHVGYVLPGNRWFALYRAEERPAGKVQR
jgi:hypothetical protein